MDRPIIYSGALPLDTDQLNASKNALIAVCKLAHAIFGDGPFVNNLSCQPTSPASLNITVQPGQIYQLGTLDATAFGSLAADSHQILNQGILQDALTFTCNPPSTPGQAMNYLVQVQFHSNDINAQVLPYYNAANPSQSLNGPGGNGAAQPTARAGQVAVQVKAGVAAATGSQQTPAADPGWIPLYVVSVMQGQTQITAANISAVAGAPFITEKLKDKISQATADQRYLQQYQADARYLQTAPVPAPVANSLNLAVADFPGVKVLTASSTVTLPLASSVAGGQVVTLKSTTTGLVRLNAQGADTIDGLTAPILRIPYLDAWDVMSNGKDGWFIVRKGDANVGDSRDYNGVSVPNGWALEDGGSLDRTQFAGLFDAIGTTWGTLDGSHFNKPDKRGRVTIGAGTGTASYASQHTLGQYGGEEKHALTSDENGPHTHSYTATQFSGNWVQGGTRDTITTTSSTTGSSGNGTPHNIMQPFAVVQKIIKL